MNTNELAPQLASRVQTLRPSSTVEMSERVRQAKREGRPIIGLSSGDPNLPTHPAVVDAACGAIRDGLTHYSASAGRSQLRRLIAERTWQRSGTEYMADNVLVTPGGKFAVYVALQTLLDRGDEVLVLEPAWVSYVPCIELAGGKAVIVDALESLAQDRLTAAINPRTKAIIVNSPVNPSGRLFTRDELQTILDAALENDLWVLFDEVYADIVFEPASFFPLYGLEGARERTLTVNSVSKTYGMTGWRLGYLVAPVGFIKAAQKIVQHSIYCVPEFVQIAGEAALQLPESVIVENVEVFGRRSESAAARLDRIPGISCPRPEATFYLFPKVDEDDRIVAKRWLDQADVAVLPGSSFGDAGAGHLRLALTCSDEELEDALQRIERVETRTG